MKQLRPAAVATAAAVALLGCTGPPEDHPTQSAPPSPLASPSSPEPAPSATWTDPEQVLGPGHGIEVLRTLPSLGDGPSVWHVLDDGRLLVEEGGELRLEDPATGAATVIDAPDADDPGGIFEADDDGRYLTWVTSSAEDLFHFPWRIYTLDLSSGVVREVARHREIGPEPVPAAPNGTRPRVHDGRVYYSAVQRIKPNGVVIPAVYSVPADGSDAPRVEVAEAYGPELLGDELVYAKSSFGFLRWTLYARTLDHTARTRVLASGPGRKQRLSGISGDGSTVMWLEKDRGRCTLRFAFATGRGRDLPTGGCGKVWASFGEVAHGIAVFSRDGEGGYRTHVCRLPDGAVYRLTSDATWGETHTNGEIVTWRPARGPHEGATFIGRLTGG